MGKHLKKYEMDKDAIHGFTWYKITVPAGKTFPLHWHDYIEFEFILSGTAKHVYNEQEYLLHKGSAYIMCYHTFHELTMLTDVVIYNIKFDKSMLHPKIAHFLTYNTFHCDFTEEETNAIMDRINLLVAETSLTDVLQEVMIKNLINELMITMIRKCATDTPQPAPLPIQQAISYVNENFTQKITLESMAKELSFSANYIGKLFKTQMKCSFNDYVNAMRLKHACSLLNSSNLSIKEIADASGYSSVEYFMYAFKKKMKMTPGEYRNLKSKKSAGR